MRNKASRPENMNTTHDATSPLTRFQGPGTVLPKFDFGREKEHFPFGIIKNKFRHDYKPV